MRPKAESLNAAICARVLALAASAAVFCSLAIQSGESAPIIGVVVMPMAGGVPGAGGFCLALLFARVVVAIQGGVVYVDDRNASTILAIFTAYTSWYCLATLTKRCRVERDGDNGDKRGMSAFV